MNNFRTQTWLCQVHGSVSDHDAVRPPLYKGVCGATGAGLLSSLSSFSSLPFCPFQQRMWRWWWGRKKGAASYGNNFLSPAQFSISFGRKCKATDDGERKTSFFFLFQTAYLGAAVATRLRNWMRKNIFELSVDNQLLRILTGIFSRWYPGQLHNIFFFEKCQKKKKSSTTTFYSRNERKKNIRVVATFYLAINLKRGKKTCCSTSIEKLSCISSWLNTAQR